MKKIQTLNALLWAILLLVVTYLFRDHEYAKYTGMIFILGYTASDLFLRRAFEQKAEKH
jgi:hypothetical protein